MDIRVAAETVARIGTLLVELERLERAQAPGVFITDRIVARPHGVILRLPSGKEVEVEVAATASKIANAVLHEISGLREPQPEADFPWSVESDVQTQWAQLHYALGAYESSMLMEADVRVLSVERHGSSASVLVVRGSSEGVESYSVDLDREIDLGLTDTIAFAVAYGVVGGSLNVD